MPDPLIGISISDRGVQAVELSRNGLNASLLAIDEWVNPFPVDADGITPERVEAFAEALGTFLSVNRIRARRTSMALDTGFLFLQRVPADPDAPREAVLDQIRWEIGQYHPGMEPGAFLSDFHRMKPASAGPAEEVLAVSLRKESVRSLTRALTALGLTVQIIDADHFSAETALRINYPDIFRRTLALVGVKENRLDVSVLRNGNLEGYSYRAPSSNQEIVETIGAISRETPGILSVMVYGPYLDTDLLQQIRRGSALLVEAMNPLRHVAVADSIRMAEHLTAPSYRFASAIGAALRRE
jgi:Tfp pilus assembly PilM family ATPase